MSASNMSDKRLKRNIATNAILAMIADGNDEIEVVDSSDTEEDYDSEEELNFLEDIDPVYDEDDDNECCHLLPSDSRTPSPPSSPSLPPPLSPSLPPPLSPSLPPPSSPLPRPPLTKKRKPALRWRTRDEPDAEPPRPAFHPKHPPGPRIDTAASWSPLSLFKLYFSSDAVHAIVNNTNAHAARRKATGGMKYEWTPLTVESFYVFLSVVMLSGVVRVHERSDMWKTEWPYNFAFPRSSMTRDRFEAIFWSLHLCDVDEDEKNQKKKGTPEYDRLFRIKPLYAQIVDACKSLLQPKREICVNERMVGSKARIGYMKDKTTMFGYKLFVLAESVSGYTWNFFVYEGKQTGKATKEGLGYSSVMDLVDFPSLGKGYHLYCDNFYTSPALFHELARNRTVACGTMRRQAPAARDNDLPANARRGDMRWLRKDDLLFVRWKDARDVTMCSSFHKAYSGQTASRRTKEAGVWGRRDVPVPDACNDYNRYRGGVDLSNALINCYSVKGERMRWYKTFFFHFVDIAIVNAHVLHKLIAKGQSQTPVSQKRFREVLMKELVDEAKAMEDAANPRPTLKNTCMPVFFGDSASALRRACEVCKTKGNRVKTPLYCSRCDVPLCLTPSRNCFYEFHLFGCPL